MSGRSNVVPMPMTTTTTPPPVPPPMPAMSMMPGQMWWGGAPPGCAPPGGSLMDCYWQIQGATQFISAIMIDAINNNPAVADAIVAALVESGSALPLIGVTNGADAQPGQVGEFVLLSQSINLATGTNTQTVSLGILQPGDWAVWAYMNFGIEFISASYVLSPQPAGFTYTLTAASASPTTTPQYQMVITPLGRALTSVPSPITFQVTTDVTTAGNALLSFGARRMR